MRSRRTSGWLSFNGTRPRLAPAIRYTHASPRPFLVPGEDPRRVLGLDPPALDRRADLQQPEVADDSAVEAAEALRPHDADRVRADPALLLQPRGGRVRWKPAQPLGVERAADADERRRLAGRKPVAVELGRREAGEVLGQRRRLEPADALRRVANEAPFDRARLARGDQLPDDGAQQRVRDGRRADRAQALEVADRPREELVVTKPLEELRVVVLHAEHEAEPLDSSFGLGAENERAVGQLACRCRFAAAQHASEDAVPKAPCRVRRAPCGERERVGAARPDRRLDGHAATLRPSPVGPSPPAGALCVHG